MTEAVAGPAEAKKTRHTTMDVIRALRQPRVAGMLALGFSCGVPFMLVGNTLGFWMREEGIELAAIGFLSWVGMAYTLKFLWAPIIDKIDAPILGKWLGRRRGWAALAQIVIGGALIAMAAIGPEGGLVTFGVFALIAAFGAATQDIVVDAWRIERAETDEELALLSAAHGIGYRIALLCTDALILILAGYVGWSTSYVAAGLAMAVGLIAVMASLEPTRRNPVIAQALDAPPIWTPRGFADAVIGPFVMFFRTHGKMALLMLAAISLFRLPDFVMGPMAGPFYLDLGIPKETVGLVRGTAGIWATIIGGVACGLFAVRFGFTTTLIVGAILGPLSNLAFSVMALAGPDLTVFTGAMIVDNFSGAFAGLALVAYMSSLTSIGYTATQYALLTSFYALLGKFLKGFSGVAVEALQARTDELTGYALFFAGTAAIGIPTLILCLILAHRVRSKRLALEGVRAP
jgi:MFS transporter, PAT family, beta-lactamase induction signal transducer AmpG